MAGSQRGQAIPTQLGMAEFEQFVLPNLSVGRRGPAPKLSLFKIFNYILPAATAPPISSRASTSANSYGSTSALTPGPDGREDRQHQLECRIAGAN